MRKYGINFFISTVSPFVFRSQLHDLQLTQFYGHFNLTSVDISLKSADEILKMIINLSQLTFYLKTNGLLEYFHDQILLTTKNLISYYKGIF